MQPDGESDAKTTLGADVTCVMTSCGRWDLLTRAVDSFIAYNSTGRFILVEDSADEAFAERVRARYPQIEVVLNKPQIGQHRAIDKAYGMVETSLILHLEDDWEFTGAASIDAARRVLASDPTVAAVCFERFTEVKLRHRIWGRPYEHDFRDLRRVHRDWYGFTFIMSLLRRKTWEDHGPYARFQNERAISRHLKAHGLGVIHVIPGVGKNIGKGRSVYDPKRGVLRTRARAFWRRLRGRGTFAPLGK